MGCCENKNSGFLKSEHNELENSPVNYNSREELEKTIENNTNHWYKEQTSNESKLHSLFKKQEENQKERINELNDFENIKFRNNSFMKNSNIEKRNINEIMKKIVLPSEELDSNRFFNTDASPAKKLFVFRPSDMVLRKQSPISNDYTIIKQIGVGAYSSVYEVIDKNSNLRRALKCVKKKTNTFQSAEDIVLKEVSILKRLDHPNMVKIIDFYETLTEFQIVTDFCSGGELFEKVSNLQHLDESSACIVMHQIFSCLEYCHSHNIVHRDIKPENILFENSTPSSIIKLIDFGTSKFYEPMEKITIKEGTTYYMAPEVILSNYDEKCDIWSCGVVLYVLLTGTYPFDGKNDEEIMNNILHSDVEFDYDDWKNISNDAKKFIKNLLTKNPNIRYSAKEALQDIWMVVNKPRRYSFNEDISPNMKTNLTSLASFKTKQDFHYIILTIMVQYLISQEEQEGIRKTFNKLDVDENGQISKEELIQGLQKLYKNSEKAQQEAKKIMKFIDNNNNEMIDYSEFMMASIYNSKFLNDQKLEMVFNIIDKNKKGYIVIEDIKLLFDISNKEIPLNFWENLFKDFSKNGRNNMNMDDFKIWMKNKIFASIE